MSRAEYQVHVAGKPDEQEVQCCKRCGVTLYEPGVWHRTEPWPVGTRISAKINDAGVVTRLPYIIDRELDADEAECVGREETEESNEGISASEGQG